MRTSKIVLLVIGVLVLVAAAVWRPLVAPQLTKLPTSLDVSYRLAGTYTGYVNQSTGARLAAPQNLPLSIDRNLKAVPTHSTSSELVVKDASAITIGPSHSQQVLQYVLDRSTSKNVKSPDAYALVPSNVVDRSGSYSLGPPPGVDTAKTYPYWVDETGTTIPMTYANATQTINGLAVQRWQTNLAATPMTASMVSAMHLPTSMPFTVFAAQLKAQGMDLAAGLRALAPSLTAAEKAKLAALTAQADPAAVPVRQPGQAAGRACHRHDRGYGQHRPVLFGPLEPRAVGGRAGAHPGRSPDQPGRRRAGRRQQEADCRSGSAPLHADLPSDPGLGG